MAASTLRFNEAARAQRQLDNTSSKLLSLPAELRNRIYHLTLSEPYVSISDRVTTPAILHTSRQLREETTPIYYGARCFGGTSKRGPDFAKWLQSLSPNAMTSLRHLAFICWRSGKRHHMHEGPDGSTVRVFHSYYQLNIRPKGDRLRYSLVCVGPAGPHLEDTAVENCTGVKALQEKLKTTLERMVEAHDDEKALRKDDVLDLLRLLR